MEEEEDDSRGEDSLQNDVAEKSLASTQVSPVSAVNLYENPQQDDADDEEAPDTSQSIDHGEQRSRSSSRDRSCLDGSQRSDDYPPPVCRNGVLDLSRRGLSSIDRKYRKDYANVRKLIISTNRFQNVSGLDMFRNCVLVDATDNQLHKLSSFLPLAKQLKALLLSNNGIKNVDSLRSFVNLENLDLSCNDIETIPSTLDNRRLARIDLSSNALTSIPDLSKLTSLTQLDISSNQISSFKTAVFPGSLLTLNVSSNNIDDLTEFMRLLPLEKLESISLANNPCVSNITFDYRIYILSVLPSLQDIDGFVVSEEEQLKGEWLYSQGKGRAFKPDTGAHLSLVKYLEKYCPFDVEGKLVSSLDQSVVKAMEKRREMLSSSAYEDDSSHSLSLHSPYRAWTAQLEGKENQIPSSSADESGASRSISARVPTSSTPARQPSMTARSSSRFEPPSRSSTMESVESSSTVTLVPAVKDHQEEHRGTSSTATTARADRSGRFYLRERIIQLEQDVETSETQQHQQIQHVEQADQRRCRGSIGHHHTTERSTARASAGRRSSEFLPQRGNAKPRAARPSPVPVVTDISVDMGPRGSHRVQHDESEVLQRLSCLEERVLQLSVQNENLTRINDELSGLLVEMTNKFRSDINSLRAQLAEVSLETTHRPDPCNLRVAREMSDGCYEIIWDMPLVQCYKVLTNGVESGIVRAPNNAARISDVEPGTELQVQVQAIHFDED
ncbi:leucine Rich repeat-containing domain protein [Ancylostoma caninum]|uniref:Leucine Rich repeat-containing domain protein n=1 Tax=Ancylostoma caninum TaxID=29170 RepID=A0A368GC79_ANCCA|nr:leucine Rich repeat-containing domain protein [Ancylostoma caninum]